jgi:hypothetical protein
MASTLEDAKGVIDKMVLAVVAMFALIAILVGDAAISNRRYLMLALLLSLMSTTLSFDVCCKLCSFDCTSDASLNMLMACSKWFGRESWPQL